jgi:DNA-binding NarL/FixJ family response regulator
MQMVRVILFEDNKSLRQSLSMILGDTEGIVFTGAFADANDAFARVTSHRPDVILMDIQMPGISGLEALVNIKAKYPETKILIQTIFEDEARIFTAICAGANGYVLKSTDTEPLIKAIFEVYGGGSTLSPGIASKVLAMFQLNFQQKPLTFIDLTQREKEVLAYLVKGQSYKMIAESCQITFNTVHSHIKNIYEKLHVNSATEAVSMAIEQKLV